MSKALIWLMPLCLMAQASADPSAGARSQVPQHVSPPLPPLSVVEPSVQRVASYDLNVVLDPRAHRIDGSGTIVFTNTSRAPIAELWFHLYLNAFKGPKTLFMRDPQKRGRSGRTLRAPSDYGRIEVRALKSSRFGNENLWLSRDTHSPGDPNDETDLRVPLPAPILPGETVKFSVEFSSHLPAILERTGHAGNFHFAGQWFPKLAKLEPNGTFAHFPFHPFSEFYANFGDYRVRITTPGSMQVAAPGALLEERKAAGGKVSRTFVIGPVHDFAFAAWEDFKVLSGTAQATKVTIFYPPMHRRAAEVTLSTIQKALPIANQRYGNYPYPQLTVVHPPDNARDAGGMEYPGLITTGGRWYEPYSGVRSIEAITVHELLHQWFYGLIASNEFDHPFLDEGVTSYAETRILKDLFGEGTVFSGPPPLSMGAAHRTIAAWFAGHRAIATPARQFDDMPALGGVIYSRTATVLMTLELVFGRDQLDAALADYTRRFRFDHPTPEDFMQALQRHLSGPALEYSRQAFFTPATVDFQLASLEVHPSSPQQNSFTSRIVVKRSGDLALPVDVLLSLSDGSKERHTWDGKSPSLVIEKQGSSFVTSAHVDPELRVLLDHHLLNNVRSHEPQSLVRSRDWLSTLAQLVVLGAIP